MDTGRSHSKPRPAPRMNSLSAGTHLLAPSPPALREQDYSSSGDEEEGRGEAEPLTGGGGDSSECEECARNQAAAQRGSLRAHRGEGGPDLQRAYSYGPGSGSEADEEGLQHQRRQRSNRQHSRRNHWQQSSTPTGGSSGGRRSATPSDRSSSRERSVAEQQSQHLGHGGGRSGVAMGTHMGTMGTVRTMDSSRSSTGVENLYSRINDTGNLTTLPLPHILPPPPDIPGPAVPPRPNPGLITSRAQATPFYAMAALPGGHRATYHELESGGGGAELAGLDFGQPQFLQTTPDGAMFFAADPAAVCNAMTVPVMLNSGGGGPAPVFYFPRTVPRTASLPRHSRVISAANSTNTLQSRGTASGEAVPMLPGGGQHGETGGNHIQPSYSFDRQNLMFTPGATLHQNAAPPQYPSIHCDFRDYAPIPGGGAGSGDPGSVRGGNGAPYNHTGASQRGGGGNGAPSSYHRVKKQLRGKCSWRCATLLLIPVTIVLLILLAYFIPMAAYDLNWALKPRHPVTPDLTPTQYPTGASSVPVPGEPVITPAEQYVFGRRAEKSVGAHDFWRAQFYLPTAQFVKFNVSVPSYALVGVYLRRSTHPTHVQYDHVHVLDGQRLQAASVGDAVAAKRRARALDSQTSHTAFIEYLETGAWFLFFYNDDTEPHTVAFTADRQEAPMSSCSSSCHGHGDCEDTQCHCFPGYTGWDCSQSVCPVVCHGNGIYVRGACECYSGWKGRECELSEDECSNPTCSGNGQCVRGTCVCAPGYKGDTCGQVDCIPWHCSQHGVCDSEGVCVCYPGYKGSDCSLPDVNHTQCVGECSGHGFWDYELRACVCHDNWSGDNCEIEICRLDCVHGECEKQRCVCEAGWTGARCDSLACDKDCHDQGACLNGTCLCRPGYNGRSCSLDGCPNNCNSHGDCRLFRDGYQCSCRDGWKGRACDVAMETDCGNALDDDRDGLYDCLDTDCCMDVDCSKNEFCATAPDPMMILLRKQAPSTTASFYDRMRFLVEDNSVQGGASLDSFDPMQVSVIRGQVVARDGSPLIGVRVSVVTQPLYGSTLTRDLGLFDILVNGGGSVILQFQRQPFTMQQTTVMVPWNEMVTISTVVLDINGGREEGGEGEQGACVDVVHDHYSLRPVIMSTWQHTQLGACPERSTIIPESQVLQESQQIPGTDIYLVYHSSEAPGYQSTVLIQLTPAVVPPTLALVHLRVAVEGLVSERTFEAHALLKYTYAWNRRNAYNQKVFGIVSARVDVGYQYSACSQVFWHTQAATMSGYDITSSEIGGWNLDIHHTYNFQEGILHKGDGTNIYLNEQPRKLVTVLGTGRSRRLDCRNCDDPIAESRLMAPVALASGRDGSLYIGDFNYVRKLSPDRSNVQNILVLNMPEVPYRYYMTVSPRDGRLYLTDYQTRQILRVKTMGAVRDLDRNFEVIAGDGVQCYPGDEGRCGDRGLATRAQLFYPKGIAISKDGVLYFADGANIRMVDTEGVVSTVIGSQDLPSQWQPLPCEGTLRADQVRLQWPTALSISPLDDSLHILDNNMVLKLTKDHRSVLVVAGYPLHCPPITSRANSLLEEAQAAPKLATEVVLRSPIDIEFSPNAQLFIVESAPPGKGANRVRVVNTDGTITLYAGADMACECEFEEGEDVEDCNCYTKGDELATKALLNELSAITVTPDNTVHIADLGDLKIHSVMATLPRPDQQGLYEILHPETQERFFFNSFGQHVATKHLVTGQFLYNFTYNVHSFYGKLTKIIDATGGVLQIRRDYTTQATDIVPPGGQKCHFTMDNWGMLESFTAADNSTTYYSYISTVELLDMKKTSSGLVYIYEYDDNGRLSEVVEPTGERLSLAIDVDATGALARIHTEHKDQIVMATNGNLLSLLHGETSTQVSYLQDGSLLVEYPFNMAVTLETSPHPLLNTEHQLHLKRKVILPGNVVHRLEWRYFPRYTRLAPGNGGGSDGGGERVMNVLRRRMRLNGVTLLVIEFDREANSESFINANKDTILTVFYNRAGNIIRTAPVSPVQGVEISYNENGRVLGWTRGSLRVDHMYDERSGYLLERSYGSRVVYRFIYKQGSKPTDVILPSGKQYLFHYDPSGNLRSVVMPSLARHRFQSLVTLGLSRKIYHPPGDRGAYIRDYNSDGLLKQVGFPSGHRRLTYYYTRTGRPEALFFDWSDVRYQYYTDEHLLHSVNISDRVGAQYACALLFSPNSSLVRTQEVRFGSATLTLANARFTYDYDSFLRMSGLQTTIGNHMLAAFNYTFNPTTGRVMKLKDFVFEYPRLNRIVLRDSHMERMVDLDSFNRVKSVSYSFNNYVKFTFDINYDGLNRIESWNRKIGTSDSKRFEYTYDVDSNINTQIENGQPVWRYEIDENSNIEKISHHNRVRMFEINDNNEIVSDGQSSYFFDKDGFLIQRGREVFEYNSRGLLTHVFEPGNFDLFYYYDGLGRMMARHNVLSGDVTQYYYANIYHKRRITHIYRQWRDELDTLFYDNQGNLFALLRNSNFYYIALNPVGSPIVIFNSLGSVEKHIVYDPLGEIITDSNEDFLFELGFQGGLHDPLTGLVFLGETGRVYHPYTGRWTSIDLDGFLRRLNQIWDTPEAANHYAYKGVVNRRQLPDLSLMTDIPSWLGALGYDLTSLIKSVNFLGEIKPSDATAEDRVMPVMSAFECAFNRDLASVSAISTVPKSKITITQSQLQVKSFEPIRGLLGKDVMLSRRDNQVFVDLLEQPDEKLALLASTLLNNSQLVDTQFTINGRDVHYFVKATLEEAQDDARTLSLRPDGGNIIGGLNVTIHRYHRSPDVMLYADYRLHGNNSVYNIRYGSTVEAERERVLNHAMERAVESAWLIERELAQSNKQSMYAWSQQQRQELLSTGKVANVRTAFFRDVSLYPELADDPKNIRFIPAR